jgi:hypothetical protein
MNPEISKGPHCLGRRIPWKLKTFIGIQQILSNPFPIPIYRSAPTAFCGEFVSRATLQI